MPMLNRNPRSQNTVNAGYLPLLVKYSVTAADLNGVMLPIRIERRPTKISGRSWRIGFWEMQVYLRLTRQVWRRIRNARTFDEPLMLDVFAVFIVKANVAVVCGIGAVVVHHHDPFGRSVIP